MNWNQPCCDFCYLLQRPDARTPIRLRSAPKEKCAWCGDMTTSGIYVRAHPSEVKFPAKDDDDE
jgi:hypothetical protein